MSLLISAVHKVLPNFQSASATFWSMSGFSLSLTVHSGCFLSSRLLIATLSYFIIAASYSLWCHCSHPFNGFIIDLPNDFSFDFPSDVSEGVMPTVETSKVFR